MKKTKMYEILVERRVFYDPATTEIYTYHEVLARLKYLRLNHPELRFRRRYLCTKYI